jgi:D-glycero-D-manno-heptose 1,7-bisphosphate phosphatase
MRAKLRKAVFLDRDGVINVDTGYVSSVQDFEFRRDIFEICRYLISLGYLIVVVTNQSGIGRQFFTKEQFKTLTDWMLKRFSEEDVEVAGVFYCPHTPAENCECRKPKPGLILEAASKFEIDLQSSWLIGDKQSDIDAAKRAGVAHSILAGDKHCRRLTISGFDYRVFELNDIKNIIKA